MTDVAERILVRATINLPGLRVGSYGLVDPSSAYIAGLIENEILVVDPDDEDEYAPPIEEPR